MKYDSGCVLHFKNVGEQTSREDIKVNHLSFPVSVSLFPTPAKSPLIRLFLISKGHN